MEKQTEEICEFWHFVFLPSFKIMFYYFVCAARDANFFADLILVCLATDLIQNEKIFKPNFAEIQTTLPYTAHRIQTTSLRVSKAISAT